VPQQTNPHRDTTAATGRIHGRPILDEAELDGAAWKVLTWRQAHLPLDAVSSPQGLGMPPPSGADVERSLYRQLHLPADQELWPLASDLGLICRATRVERITSVQRPIGARMWNLKPSLDDTLHVWRTFHRLYYLHFVSLMVMVCGGTLFISTSGIVSRYGLIIFAFGFILGMAHLELVRRRATRLPTP
jgi:hypothetical protein